MAANKTKKRSEAAEKGRKSEDVYEFQVARNSTPTAKSERTPPLFDEREEIEKDEGREGQSGLTTAVGAKWSFHLPKDSPVPSGLLHNSSRCTADRTRVWHLVLQQKIVDSNRTVGLDEI